MKRKVKVTMKAVLLFLALLQCTSIRVHAVSFDSQKTERQLEAKKPVCPADDLGHFLLAYSEDIELQKKHIRFPLKKLEIDWEAKPGPKPVIRMLNQDQIHFPIFPNSIERRNRSIGIGAFHDEPSGVNVTVVIKEGYSDWAFSYEFEKNDCWTLVGIEEMSLSRGKHVVKEWLEKLFPKLEKCTPTKGIYYDLRLGRTNSGLLEKLGYTPEKITDEIVTYRINEDFYGMPAVELTIPSGTYSGFAVTIPLRAEEVKKRLLAATGYAPGIYRKKHGFASGVRESGTHESGVGYLFVKEENIEFTQFICTTLEGE